MVFTETLIHAIQTCYSLMFLDKCLGNWTKFGQFGNSDFKLADSSLKSARDFSFPLSISNAMGFQHSLL